MGVFDSSVYRHPDAILKGLLQIQTAGAPVILLTFRPTKI
jgi:hypothetical protein